MKTLKEKVIDFITENNISKDQLIKELTDVDTDIVDIPDEFLVGTLTCNIGIKGYDVATPGHAVYENKGRYVIYLTRENLEIPLQLTYNKETLKEFINFSK